jgi:hypothetical protein
VGAKRANIKAFRSEGRQQRLIVDLWVMRQKCNCSARIQSDIRQDFIRPFHRHFDIRESFPAGESAARVDEKDIVTQSSSHGYQRLRYVNGAYQNKLEGWILDINEILPLTHFDHATFIEAKSFLQGVCELVASGFMTGNKPLFTIGEIAYQCNGGTRIARVQQLVKRRRAHRRSASNRLNENPYLATARETNTPGGFVGNTEA